MLNLHVVFIMSDVPPIERLDSYLQWKFCIESPSLAYASQSAKKDVHLGFDTHYPLLKSWHSLVVLKKTIQHSHESPIVSPLLGQIKFTELLGHSISGNSFAIQ